MSEDTETTPPLETPASSELPADGVSWENIDTGEAKEGEPDHEAAGDDNEDEEVIVTVSQADAQPGPDHPSNPGGLYPIPPKPNLTAWIAISNAERLEKGELFAKKTVEIEALEAERSEITANIGKAKKMAILLRNAFLTGKVEVPAEQTDLLRQDVGPESAATQFESMRQAAEAAQAAPEAAPEAPADASVEASPEAVADAKTEEDLNNMAADIQADQGIQAPGPQFLNDIEAHKAKSAAKRKSGKAK